jgi:glycosyltransferase involved in cell wall biosynthesis
MNILFVSSCFPYDLRTKVHGVYKRMNMFIDGIKGIASLTMLFYVPAETDVTPSSVIKLEQSLSEHWNTKVRLYLCQLPKYDDIKKKGILFKLWYYYGAGAFNFYRQPRFMSFSGPQQVQAFESCLLHNPDAIFVHKLHCMCPALLTEKELPPLYFDLDDIEHIVFRRSIRQLARWYEKALKYLQLPMLLWGQLRAIRLARNTFVCSELDRRYLKDRWSLEGVVTIPNAVSIPEKQDISREPAMLFLGSYNYPPNAAAAEFLIEKVWPGVYKAIPSARLIIAGAGPENIRGYGADTPGVTFTGFVDDLEELYGEARIVCAPIFEGGGTRVKIVEAAAHGIPVVSTTMGAEGLNMRDGTELLLRDDSESFADACMQLLDDPERCRQLGLAARNKAVELYDRNNVVRLVQKYLRQDQAVNHKGMN